MFRLGDADDAWISSVPLGPGAPSPVPGGHSRTGQQFTTGSDARRLSVPFPLLSAPLRETHRCGALLVAWLPAPRQVRGPSHFVRLA